MMEQVPVVVMDFSGVYSMHQEFLRRAHTVLDVRSIHGTACYLDPEAEQSLRNLIEPYAGLGIHFIDKGDYHYMTRLWCGHLHEDYALILLDHHPDTQSPRFEGMSSCGSWLRELMLEDGHLKKAYILGASPQLYGEALDLGDRVCFYSKDMLGTREGILGALRAVGSESLPVYVSLDLDVLSERVFKTNWDQGDMTWDMLCQILDHISFEKVLGVDVCGEESMERQGTMTYANPIVMDRLLDRLLQCFGGNRPE